MLVAVLAPTPPVALTLGGTADGRRLTSSRFGW